MSARFKIGLGSTTRATWKNRVEPRRPDSAQIMDHGIEQALRMTINQCRLVHGAKPPPCAECLFSQYTPFLQCACTLTVWPSFTHYRRPSYHATCPLWQQMKFQLLPSSPFIYHKCLLSNTPNEVPTAVLVGVLLSCAPVHPCREKRQPTSGDLDENLHHKVASESA